mmetsp:Transcript_23205/g.54324  ORF Transcript_23205/g.54324 Transcript_23205/m.54324 type:complete len:266 (-) Transcript_23205:92-889(-)
MKPTPCLAALALLVTAANAVRSNHGANQSSCLARDEAQRALLQDKLKAFGVVCEDMCKRTNQYPNCQCPGFEGNAASDDDSRRCITKYCQDPETPCPNDNFVACVKGNTKVSVLQWSALLQRTATSLCFGEKASSASVSVPAGTCEAQDSLHRAFLQAKLAVFGVECEEMCKRMGQYPHCQCPGFDGNPASDGDERKCYDKHCQDPSTPCPTDNFVICVREVTKVSVLQWAALLQRFDASMKLWSQTLAARVTTGALANSTQQTH